MEIDHSSEIGDDMDFTTNSPFSKSLMTGLALGVSDTIICLLYNVFYRNDATNGFFSSDFISVSTIIFGINVLMVVIGVLFYFVQNAGRGAEMVFSLIFAALTVAGVIGAFAVHTWTDVQNHRFHGLLAGIVILVGLSIVLMPFIFHSKKFGQYVL